MFIYIKDLLMLCSLVAINSKGLGDGFQDINIACLKTEINLPKALHIENLAKIIMTGPFHAKIKILFFQIANQRFF